MKKKILACALAAAISCGFAYEAEAATRAEISQIAVSQKGSNFKYWNKDAASYRALTDYIRDITNKHSQNFIPVEDRAAFFVLCDDLQRELGNEEKAAQCRKLAAANGWHTISMRDDFKTIYGDDVKRTVR